MLTKKADIGSPLKALRGKMKRLGIIQKDVDEAFQWARSKKKKNNLRG